MFLKMNFLQMNLIVLRLVMKTFCVTESSSKFKCQLLVMFKHIIWYPTIEMPNVFLEFAFVLRVTITTDDPQWVGAWWIGFLFSGFLAFLLAIPLCGFPKSLPGKGSELSEFILWCRICETSAVAITLLYNLQKTIRVDFIWFENDFFGVCVKFENLFLKWKGVIVCVCVCLKKT